MPKVTLNQTRVEEIAASMRSLCVAVLAPHEQVAEAKGALDTAREVFQTSRLGVAVEIAHVSAAGRWTEREISAGAKAAAGASNDPDAPASKALATFISEMRTVAHPAVREHFDDILAACEDVWAAEEAELTAPGAKRAEVFAPVHKWTSRKYHLVMNVCRAAKNDGDILVNADAITEYAVAHDPDLNAEKVQRRLENVVDILQGIFADFPLEAIKDAYEYLAVIKPKELIEAKAIAQAAGTAAAARVLVPAPADMAEEDMTPEDDAAIEEEVSEPEEAPVVIEANRVDKLFNDIDFASMIPAGVA